MEYIDVTFKAPVTDVESVTRRLMQLGARFVGRDQQTDRYYRTDKGKLKWRQGSIENVITHYERKSEGDFERTFVYRYERNPAAEEIEQLNNGFELIGVVVKQRDIFSLDNIKIHLDTLETGEQFIEIEVFDRTANQSTSELAIEGYQLLHQLDISNNKLISTGYFPNNFLE